jgi:hypothetical protein
MMNATDVLIVDLLTGAPTGIPRSDLDDNLGQGGGNVVKVTSRVGERILKPGASMPGSKR